MNQSVFHGMSAKGLVHAAQLLHRCKMDLEFGLTLAMGSLFREEFFLEEKRLSNPPKKKRFAELEFSEILK